jgi:hypothetical protein
LTPAVLSKGRGEDGAGHCYRRGKEWGGAGSGKRVMREVIQWLEVVENSSSAWLGDNGLALSRRKEKRE